MPVSLKKVYADVILQDIVLQSKIAIATGRSAETVKRWAKGRNELLMLQPAIDVLKEHLKLADSVILIEKVDADKIDGLGNLVA